MKTTIVATGEVKDALTLEDYLGLVEANGYAPAHAAMLREQLARGDASARFTVYGTALRLGHITKAGQGERYARWLAATGQ